MTWYNDPENEDKPIYTEEEDFTALTLNANGLSLWCSTFGPDRVIGKYMCIGSGAQVAETALHLGKTPEEAIKIACKLDIFSCTPVQKQMLYK